jgi:hypothetical protein
MSVIIKYLVEFPDVSLKVSNDIILGDYTLDASITIPMKRGTDGCSFQIDLFDLPPVKQNPSLPLPTLPLGGGGQQKSALNDLGKKVAVSLGYFGGPFGKVLDGIIDSTTLSVQGESLVTTIKGLETAIHALKETPFASTFPSGASVQDAIGQLLKNTTIKGGEVTLEPVFTFASPALGSDRKFENKTIRGAHLSNGLDNLVTYLNAEMVVGDKKIRIGNPVKNDNDYSPDKFVPGVSLAKFGPYEQKIPDGTDKAQEKPPDGTTANGFSFTVIGDPKLRPAQKVSVELDNFPADGEYRIQEVTHRLSTSSGYVCEGTAMKVVSDDNAKRRQDRVKKPSADSIVDGLGLVASAHRRQNPSVEVGTIKAYTEGSAGSSDPGAPARHSASVYYGQVYDQKETQPSIHVPVENLSAQVAASQPVVSPFAWHKCGLVVPIYPGMKTVLSHNLALEDDSLISGFLWSTDPAFDPPPNKKGDWWLCLPVFNSAGDPPSPPPDDTKAANDLTAQSGLRVIELSGLRITIGKLQGLGTRPTEGSADEFLIEHKKAKVHIASDGSIDIVADADGGKGKFSIASGGDITMSATGGVTLKISDSAVEIS